MFDWPAAFSAGFFLASSGFGCALCLSGSQQGLLVLWAEQGLYQGLVGGDAGFLLLLQLESI